VKKENIMIDYTKKELLDKINLLSITRNGNTVITKYNDRLIRTSDVSNRYEVFDIVTYLKDTINLIEKNFDIVGYDFKVYKGIQSLTLYSDQVKIGEDLYRKTFHILNSTDRTRRLSFSMGLKSKSGITFIPGTNNIELSTKHIKGVTEKASRVDFDVETFNQQIQSIKTLLNQNILFSSVRKSILGDSETIPEINHKKFDTFKNLLLYSGKIDKENRMLLYRKSKYIKEIKKEDDFLLDAYFVFQTYLTIFKKQDSHIIKNESLKVEKMTQYHIRKEKLKSILSI
jgi:hypothetical protein